MFRKLLTNYRSTGRLLITAQWRRYRQNMTDEERYQMQKRQTRLISVLAGSTTAIIGCSILIYKQLTGNKVQAEVVDNKLKNEISSQDGAIDDTDASDTDNENDNDEQKFHRRTFRERKVINSLILLNLLTCRGF